MAAIVTGGASGIGAAITKALLKEGYKVCVADIQEDKGNEFVAEQRKEHGEGNVIFSCCDVTKESDYTRTFDMAVKAFQKVDVLMNNAGISSERNPRALIDINLMGPINGCQTAIKYMGKSNGGKGGMVISTASIIGIYPYHLTPVYSTSKQGVVGLTRSYGHPYYEEKEGILFAALCPSLTDTPLLDRMKQQTTQPLDLLDPDYVAQGVVKILKDRVNGACLIITKDKGYQYYQFPKYEDIFQ